MEEEPRRLHFIPRIRHVDQFINDPQAIGPAVQETGVDDIRHLWFRDEEFAQVLDSGQDLGRYGPESVVDGGIVLQAIGGNETQVHDEVAEIRILILVEPWMDVFWVRAL
jgi:hypothetical protein